MTYPFQYLITIVHNYTANYVLEKLYFSSLIIFIGTSGDTGSAAIEAVKGKRWIDIIVLYPKVNTIRYANCY